MAEPGTLYLIPTPIGNLADMTFRACDTLRRVDLVACEDTRTSARLFDEYDIQTPRTSFHLHNEHRKTPVLVEKLLAGAHLAMISDAGTPAISDPGFLLVRACVEAGIRVEALPGPTAFVPALIASGLPCDRFVFEGFLPLKKGRKKRLQELADQDRTIVFYEAPHRLVKLLEQMSNAFGADRPCVVCRELSKKFETYHRGRVSDVLIWAETVDRVKGEIVVIVAGKGYYERLRAADTSEEEAR